MYEVVSVETRFTYHLVLYNEFLHLQMYTANPAANCGTFPTLPSPKGLHSLELLPIPMLGQALIYFLPWIPLIQNFLSRGSLTLCSRCFWLLSLSVKAQGSPTLQPASVPLCFLSLLPLTSLCLLGGHWLTSLSGCPILCPPLWNAPYAEQLPAQAIPEVHNPLGTLPPAPGNTFLSPFHNLKGFKTN